MGITDLVFGIASVLLVGFELRDLTPIAGESVPEDGLGCWSLSEIMCGLRAGSERPCSGPSRSLEYDELRFTEGSKWNTGLMFALA